MTVNVYHKHSVVKDKAPDAKQAELGEILLNANQDSPALYIKDSADRVVQVGGDFTQLKDDVDALHNLVENIEELKKLLDGNPHLHSLLEKLAEIDDKIANLTQYVNNQDEEIHTALKALEAQVLLSAKHNADQDRHLQKIDTSLRVHEADIMALVKRVELLEASVINNVDALEDRIEALEKLEINAGIGIKVEIKDSGANPYGFTVKIDKDYLDERIAKAVEEALRPYALKDISENTPELDDA